MLVNDFAAVGIDGSLLTGQGAEVVELPNGCICCSLRDDLASQLLETVTRYAPDRVLIEPSGVADIASLIGVMRRPALAPYVKDIEITTVIDAGAFLADYARLPGHFAAQARLAGTLIINKADLVSMADRRMVAETLRRLNPGVQLRTARYGQIDPDVQPVLALVRPGVHHDHAHHDGHAHHDDAEHAHAHSHAGHEHAHDHAGAELGFVSCHFTLPGMIDSSTLQTVLEQAVGGAFGEIIRVKGIARVSGGWINFDVAGGRASFAAFSAGPAETPRLIAIGRSLEEAAFELACNACAVKQAA